MAPAKKKNKFSGIEKNRKKNKPNESNSASVESKRNNSADNKKRKQPDKKGQQQTKKNRQKSDNQQSKKQKHHNYRKTKQQQQRKQQKKPKQQQERTQKSQDKKIPQKKKVEKILKVSPKIILSKNERRDEYLSQFITRIENFINQKLFIEDGSRMIVAVSGGVDSAVLLDSLMVLTETHHYNLTVAHYNHNLRGSSSDRDEEFVKNLAKKYDLQFISSRGKVKQYSEKHSLSVEHSARILRYMFLERTARKQGTSIIATAHNLDDSAETFLLNLIRGSGLTGLSGIPPKRGIGRNVTVIRPLIEFKKTELLEYAKKRNLKWQEDETNVMLNYTRNRIRHELIPGLQKNFNPSIIDTINRSARLINGADKFISGHVKDILPDIVIDKQSDRFSVKISLLRTFDDFFQGEIIQAALDKHLQIKFLSMNSIDRILKLQESSVGAVHEIQKQVVAIKERNKIIFARKNSIHRCNMIINKNGEFDTGKYKLRLTEVSKRSIRYKRDPNVEFLDMDKIPMLMTLRNWTPGDSFNPLGLNGTMKVSDFLTNIKVSSLERQNVLVLASKNDIIWVCGRRISENYKIEKNTKRVVKAEFIEKKENN